MCSEVLDCEVSNIMKRKEPTNFFTITSINDHIKCVLTNSENSQSMAIKDVELVEPSQRLWRKGLT